MKFRLIHQSPNRFHLDLTKKRLTESEADVLYYTLIEMSGVTHVKVYTRTAQLAVIYNGVRSALLDLSLIHISEPTRH